MSEIKHDLDHEVYLDPKDGKEHINHGKMEYSKEDLESSHAYYDEYHKNDEPETGINDWHTRHQDSKHLRFIVIIILMQRSVEFTTNNDRN